MPPERTPARPHSGPQREATPVDGWGPSLEAAPPLRPGPAPQAEGGSASSASGEVVSSPEPLTRQTLGWSGEPAEAVPLGQSHRRQIFQGLQYFDQRLPGVRQQLDALLAPDSRLEGELSQLSQQQGQLFSRHARLLQEPEDRLSSAQRQQRQQVQRQIDAITSAYNRLEAQKEEAERSRLEQARILSDHILDRLREGPTAGNVGDRVQVDEAARAQLEQSKITPEKLKGWVNEFHHLTGLPAPKRLKFICSEKRPKYFPASDSINVGNRFSKHLALHELAHRIEYRIPEISLASKSWVAARSQKLGFSDEPVSLKQLVPKGSYGDDEKALEDSFVDPYVGKLYPDMATEVLSVGLEHFADAGRFLKLYRQDPEHVMLTLGALQLMREKGEAW